MLAVSAVALGLVVFRLVGLDFLRLHSDTTVIHRPEDFLFASMWVGLAGFGSLFTLWALAYPVTLSAAAILLILPWLNFVRGDFRQLISRELGELFPDRRTASIGIVIVSISILPVAYLASAQFTLFDTAYYHLPLTRIFNEFGAVIGLAALHTSFGQVSAWFALAAPGTAGGEFGWGAASANFFIAAMAACHAAMAIGRCVKGDARLCDFVMAIGTPLVLIAAARWNMIASVSPDLPVMLLCVVTAWALCLETSGADMRRLGVTCAVMVAVFAVSIKISSAPLLVLSSLAAIYGIAGSSRTLFRLGGVAVVGLTPSLALGVLASGCLAYPLAVSCIALPWTPNLDDIALFATTIMSAAKGGGLALPAETPFWEVIRAWSFRDSSGALIVFTGLICSLLIVWRMLAERVWRNDRKSFPIWAAILAIFGVAYVTVTAPTGRFMGGYAAVSVGIAIFILPSVRRRVESLIRNGLLPTLFLICLLGIHQTGPSAVTRSGIAEGINSGIFPDSGHGWFLPAKLIPFDVHRPDQRLLSSTRPISEKFKDVRQSYGRGECWATPPPCASGGYISERLQYRDAGAGIQSVLEFRDRK